MNAFNYMLRHPAAQPPTYATAKAAGADLTLVESHTFVPGEPPVMLDTGVAVAIPDGYVGLLSLRSSLGDRGFSMPNTPGIIDSDYRGTIKVLLALTDRHRFTRALGRVLHIRRLAERGTQRLGVGERVVQMVVVPHLTGATEADVLPESNRGEGGFGSTGTTTIKGTDK